MTQRADRPRFNYTRPMTIRRDQDAALYEAAKAALAGEDRTFTHAGRLWQVAGEISDEQVDVYRRFKAHN